MVILAVILVIAAVLLALCDRLLITVGVAGTTEVGETSSSEEDSSSSLAARLLGRFRLFDCCAGVGGTSVQSPMSKLISSSNFPAHRLSNEYIEMLK